MERIRDLFSVCLCIFLSGWGGMGVLNLLGIEHMFEKVLTKGYESIIIRMSTNRTYVRKWGG